MSSGWKGRTKDSKKFEKAIESTWKRKQTQAGLVCRLTSGWKGRLRAAHSDAPQPRVRRQIHKRLVDFSHIQFAIGCAPVEEANVLRYFFIGGEQECRESESKNGSLAVCAHRSATPKPVEEKRSSVAHRVAGRFDTPDIESLKVSGSPFKVRSVARLSH